MKQPSKISHEALRNNQKDALCKKRQLKDQVEYQPLLLMTYKSIFIIRPYKILRINHSKYYVNGNHERDGDTVDCSMWWMKDFFT